MKMAMAMASLLLAAVCAPLAHATDQRNLETCLSGKYPALCNYAALTAEQLRLTRTAEHRENLSMCLTGKYPALCRHGELTPEERARVGQAERQANWETCSSGKYPALCKHSLLTPDQATRVSSAEAAENRRTCLDGRYPALCKHTKLSPSDLKAARSAEAKASADAPSPSRESRPAPTSGSRSRSNCESGHWIQEVSGNGKILKLENGTIWEVDDIDTVTTSIWLPVSEVLLCGDRLINTDDGESVTVTPLKGGTGSAGTGKPSHVVEASANDETFVINGGVFKAKTYCFGLEKGDRVVFVKGSALGACASAKIVNLRTGKTCDLWCE